MGQALYRKHRPRIFADAVGQDYITTTLEQAIKSGRVSHAYLFAGPRGVGQTSIARILAHEVNDLPYSDDSFHLDIIEIDAASNRRIDEIRDLRDKVNIAPTSAKYKVYIIDEVHMLTKEAFNALLKTLEEPPAHCIFILATTEAHKLPDTIISRTQRFDFKPIGRGETALQLQKIAKAEKINISTDAIGLLADYGEGSLRDIIGMLDQLGSSSNKIEESNVRNLLGLPPQKTINRLAQEISESELKASLAIIESLKEQGVSPQHISQALSKEFRSRIFKNDDTEKWTNEFLRRLVEVHGSSNPQESLELAVIEAAGRAVKADLVRAAVSARVNRPSATSPAAEKGKFPPDNNHPQPARKTGQISTDIWQQVLTRVRVDAPSLYTALRLAEPSMTDNKLNLAFHFPLHQKKIMAAKNKALVSSVLQQITGNDFEITCTVDKEARLSNKVPASDADMRTISNIFGSAEVLES